MRCSILVSAVIVASGLAPLPGSGALAQEERKVDVRGKIARVNKITDQQKDAGIVAIVLIDGGKKPTTHYDKAVVKITKKTKIWKQDGNTKKPGAAMDLKLGATAEAIFIGPVAESYPVQATASEIVILAAKE